MDPLEPLDNYDPPPPQLPCTVEETELYGIPSNNELAFFWDNSRSWFAHRGVFLHHLVNCGHAIFRYRRWLCPPVNASAPPPSSTYLSPPSCGPYLRNFYRGIAFAQDHANRNLVLKIIDNTSPEHPINQHLLHQMSEQSKEESFPCVLAPIAILDTPTDCSFLVMPMWGSIYPERMQRVQEIVQFARCTLRGLSYLHRLRIVHRDICDHNILVNCHSPGATLEEFPELFDAHLRSDNAVYAFIDFGQSLQLPPDTSITDCRRPGDETGIAMNLFKPWDGCLGEPYYNPFSYDVAALGYLFRYYFAEAVSVFPALAALFDRMTDFRSSCRMTAQEALEWFEEAVAQLPLDRLEARVTLDRSFEAMRDEGFYWKKLSSEDQVIWSQYRTPPRPLWMRLLGLITRYRLVFRMLCYVRELLQI